MKKNLGNIISWSSVLIVIFSIYTYDPLIITIAIFIAAIMDMFDGKYARMYGENTSEAHIFGEITDSLCDLFNFGITPSLILLHVNNQVSYNFIFLIASAFFIWAGIYRLARFSATKSRHSNQAVDYYIGLPITIAGPVLAFFINIITNQYIIIGITFLLGWTMITKLQVKKIKI